MVKWARRQNCHTLRSDFSDVGVAGRIGDDRADDERRGETTAGVGRRSVRGMHNKEDRSGSHFVT
jgi:hypothetical protein